MSIFSWPRFWILGMYCSVLTHLIKRLSLDTILPVGICYRSVHQKAYWYHIFVNGCQKRYEAVFKTLITTSWICCLWQIIWRKYTSFHLINNGIVIMVKVVEFLLATVMKISSEWIVFLVEFSLNFFWEYWSLKNTDGNFSWLINKSTNIKHYYFLETIFVIFLLKFGTYHYCP